MRRTGARGGVTLIELLIAVTLVSLLAVEILFSMRVGLTALGGFNGKVVANRRTVGVERALDAQVAGLIPVATPCGPGGAQVLFFQGEPDQMRFVSGHSLEEGGRGYPRVLEFAVIPGDRNVGVRLVVNEIPYTGPLTTAVLCAAAGREAATGLPQNRFVPVQAGPRSFVLADRLAHCRFAYLLGDPQSGRRRWMPVFAGSRPPLAIRVEMTPLEPDPSRLQMGSMTLPVRVGRDVLEKYADIEEQ